MRRDLTGQWPVLARAVAAHGLVGTTLGFPDAPIDPLAWRHLIGLTKHQRITGLLLSAIVDGALPATAEQREEAEVAHKASMMTALALDATLVGTARWLDDAGVGYRVIKGTGVAHLDYPDPAMRSFGDIDLLVRSSQYDDAVEALVAAGHRRRFPEPRPAFDRRFGKGTCLVSAQGVEIDLHRTLAMGPFGLSIDLEDLWRRSSPFEVGGRGFAALGPEERFLHACLHAVLGDNPPRLLSLRDVAQMHVGRPLDVATARRLSTSWGADAAVARAVITSAEVLGLDRGPLVEWAIHFSPSARDRQALAVYTEPTASYAAKSLAAVRAIPRWRDRVAFLVALAFPGRGYLEERGERRPQRWRRGLEQIWRARRRI